MTVRGSPFNRASGGVTVAIHLSPKASHNHVGESVATAGGVALKVRVTAAPEKGRANKALIRLVAKEWGLAARDLGLASGATSRHKVVRVTGEDAAAVLEHWWTQRPNDNE